MCCSVTKAATLPGELTVPVNVSSRQLRSFVPVDGADSWATADAVVRRPGRSASRPVAEGVGAAGQAERLTAQGF